MLGPLSCSAYKEDVVDLLDQHEVQSHLYADYTQLYASCRPGDVDILRTRLSHCSADVATGPTRQIRRRVGAEVTTQLVLALLTSRLDYCNAILAGVPQSTLEPLQRVRNAAARTVHQLNVRYHVTLC